MAHVKIPTPLRRHTGGASAVEVQGVTVSQVLQDLQTRYPALRERIWDEQGQIKSHLNLFVNNEDVRFLQGIYTPLREGDVLTLLPALAGG